MLKKLATATLSLALAASLNAEPLWSNQAKKGDDFFLGTIHLGDERLNGLPQSVMSVIDSVDTVVLELDLTATTPQQQQQIVFKYAMLPAGQTLKTVLSADVYQQVAEFLAKRGAMVEQFAQLQPWMVALTMVQMAYAESGLVAQYGVDSQVYQYAKSKGKKIVALETFEQQIQFFDQIIKKNDISHDDLMKDTLYELKEFKDMPQTMLNAWIKGDTQAFEKLYVDTLTTQEYDKIAEKILLTDRNERWHTQLTPMLKNESVLVAVGALHFSGPKGLTKLFKGQFQQIK